jgi:hypothetical protein
MNSASLWLLCIAGSLFAIACALPSYTMVPANGYWHSGLLALFFGWYQAPLAWVANPLIAWAAALGLARFSKTAVCMSGLAVLASLTCLRVSKLQGMGDWHGVTPGIGAYVWMASILLAFIALARDVFRQKSTVGV